MSGWHEGRLCVFDTETTGPDPEEARIVQASVAYVGGGERPQFNNWLINPGVEIPEAASAIHGITTERAQADGVAATAVADIGCALREAWAYGVPVVAFNAAYDFTVLDRDLARNCGFRFEVGGPVVDPYVIDREVDRYRKGKRTLGAMCEHYGVRLDGAHDATADAVAAGRVAWAIASRFPKIAGMPLPELHEAQARWHAERQADFAAYLRRSGKPADDVCGEWPMRSVTVCHVCGDLIGDCRCDLPDPVKVDVGPEFGEEAQ